MDLLSSIPRILIKNHCYLFSTKNAGCNAARFLQPSQIMTFGGKLSSIGQLSTRRFRRRILIIKVDNQSGSLRAQHAEAERRVPPNRNREIICFVKFKAFHFDWEDYHLNCNAPQPRRFRHNVLQTARIISTTSSSRNIWDFFGR